MTKRETGSIWTDDSVGSKVREMKRETVDLETLHNLKLKFSLSWQEYAVPVQGLLVSLDMKNYSCPLAKLCTYLT